MRIKKKGERLAERKRLDSPCDFKDEGMLGHE